MYHGHADMGGGVRIETAGFIFAWFIGSILAAYYAMKFTAARREARERQEKILKRQRTA